MNPAVDDATGTGYLHPRNPVELWLARQWQEVLGFGVGIRENFFEIGGNSLDAARIINAVLEEFGVQLPLNVMTENPTVEALADRLGALNERLSGPLQQIQRGDGSLPALFLVHPASGQVGSYSALAHELGEEFTVFGLQAAGLYTGAEPVRTVPAMARAYLEAVRAVQPTGPYLLGGCDTGAAIAYEMATRLGPAEVRLLAAIDAGLVPQDEPADAAGVWQANRDAVRDWRPEPYPGTLDVLGSGSTVDWPATVRVHDCTADGRPLAVVLRELIGDPA
ncbi:thioesterase domain-containing protein [Actinophytocola sp.]|uniref:thioesterase domain-containing protein n=1 Tax=Actinophytocola sp. TaxID=1872138 RepID=UPI002D80FCAF|nr:thioesterase domain-containing protein [Actinophytocola sp.]HET9143118.1 thioesterase domain-containing protein [Actinophytocola sp.]